MSPRFSIINRLTHWWFASACVLLISATTLMYWSLVEVIRHEERVLIDTRMETLRSVLGRPKGALEAAERRMETEWPHISPQKIYVRLSKADGTQIVISPATPAEVVTSILDNHPKKPVRTTLPSGRPFIAASDRVSLADGTPVIADVAIDLSDDEKILPSFRDRMIPILLLELAIAFLIGRKLARSSLSPVKRIAARASEIGPSNLDERIETEELPEELLLLVTTFNEMLNRLSESFTRLSRFSSDIAHELRTPINNMRGEIEIALSKSRNPSEYEEILASALEEIGRLTQITDALLFLAKSENPQTQLDRESCDIRTELDKVAELFETMSSEAGVSLVIDAPENNPAWANRTLFRQAIANLTANAIAHTQRGGQVQLKGWREKENCIIEVADTGEGIAPEHLTKIFDRFYRVDPSRSSRTGVGSGLGLSIVQGIVKLHGGKIDIRSQRGQGTQVRLSFPERIT